jgi:subtilase family serine protease
MGLSVGWYDIYQSDLFGQELDVRGIPAGRYCLAMAADPGERIAETNETDNGRSTVVEIAGPKATDLGRRCPGESR